MSAMDEGAATMTRPVELILPADLDMAPLLRLVSAQLGVEAGMSLDDVDDLRLVATEVFSSAIEGGDVEAVSVAFRVDDGSVSATFSALGGGGIELDELAARILASGVDELEMERGVVRFEKRANPD